MSRNDWDHEYRRGAYDDYDHSDEELYVDDQCCKNCRFFSGFKCTQPERDEFDYPGPKDWCELWKGRGRRSGGLR